MSTHVCVYFDDGDLEPGCVCGEAVALLVDDDGVEVLVVLDAAPVPDTLAALDHRVRELVPA